MLVYELGGGVKFIPSTATFLKAGVKKEEERG
jgi:hypothetical protein